MIHMKFRSFYSSVVGFKFGEKSGIVSKQERNKGDAFFSVVLTGSKSCCVKEVFDCTKSEVKK